MSWTVEIKPSAEKQYLRLGKSTRQRVKAAIRSLEAFINAVEAQRGKKITGVEADVLVGAAQEIIELLGDG